jgi:hypothetical protein
MTGPAVIQALQNADPASASNAGPKIGRVDRAVVWVCAMWLTTFLLEGPLRGALVEVGVPDLLYARDLIPVLGVALAFAVPLINGRPLPPGLLVVSWLLAVHLCVGLLSGGSVFQRMFGLKVFIPLLFAVAIFPNVLRGFQLFMRVVGAFFVVSVAGVLINYAVDVMPWEGLSYDTAFGSMQTTRQWWIPGGVRRLPGFARASFDAAMIIGLTGVMLLAQARQRWLRALIVAAGATTIVLTTSKGMVIAFAVAAGWLLVANRSGTSLKVGKAIAGLLLLVTCLVPTIFMVLSVSESTANVPEMLMSLWDRFSWMWPGAYALLPDGFGALTGTGLGGIGAALEYAQDRGVSNAADSIFVFYFVTFGVVGIAYVAFPLLAVLRKDADADPYAFVWVALLIIAYGYGLSINMIEQPVFATMFGLLYARAFAAFVPYGSPA